MAENIPVNFPIPTERAIASFSFTDLAEGTGVVEYTLGVQNVEGTESFFLSTTAGWNSSVAGVTTYKQEETENDTSFAKTIDIDFDLTAFNLPRRIRGTGRCQINFGGGELQPNNSGETYIICRIRKWDGSSETEIASGQSQTRVIASNVANNRETGNIPITIPLTSYKKGETLRVTIEQWSKKTSSSVFTARFAHDPQDTDQTEFGGTDFFTTLKVQIPYVIDV